MINRILLLSASLLLLWSCHDRKAVTVGGITVPVALLDYADEYDFDYTGELAKAIKKEEPAIRNLLSFTGKTDASSIQEHGQVLTGLIQSVGDEYFASIIKREPAGIRSTVWRALEKGKQRPLKEMAPTTRQALFPEGRMEAFRGLYVFDRKLSTFRDCSNPDAVYVAVDETGEIERNFLQVLRSPYPGQPVYAELNGFTAGYFADRSLPGNFEGFLIVKDIGALQKRNSRNNCLPIELWAIGTEPFWSLLISRVEGIIEFQEAGKSRTRAFPYVSPIDGEKETEKVYPSLNETTGDNIRIAVDTLPCSDGMSDENYPIKVTVTMNGRTFEGCGQTLQAEARPGD